MWEDSRIPQLGFPVETYQDLLRSQKGLSSQLLSSVLSTEPKPLNVTSSSSDGWQSCAPGLVLLPYHKGAGLGPKNKQNLIKEFVTAEDRTCACRL